MTTRWARFARGWFVAVFATFVAAFSHVFAGGSHPPPFAIALALAFSAIACIFLAGGRLSRLRLSLSVAFSQLLYHGLFGIFGASGDVAAPAAITTVGHQHGSHPAATITSDASSSVGFAGADPGMLMAHAAAGVATFALLVYGESLCAGLVRLTGLVINAFALRMPWSPVPTTPRLFTATGSRGAIPHKLALLASSLRHRGPPRALPAA